MKTRIACIQFEPRVDDPDGNRNHSLGLVDQAVAEGAGLVVLPELANSGYVFESMEEAWALAEPIPSGVTCQAWIEAAKRHQVHIVAGINERTEDCLFNSAILAGPDGYLGTYRKVHLWNQENRFFQPGDLGFPVFETTLGRIGILICYDGWFPESARECALNGADIICVPTNWVPIPGQKEDREAMATILTMSAAHSNRLPIACASRIGIERKQPFIGQSQIVAYSGWPVAGPASTDQEEIIYADLDLRSPGRSADWNEYNRDPLGDRRPECYTASAGSHSS